MSFYAYIVASSRNGTLYVGMTDDLARRIWEHKTRAIPRFTAKYGCDQLVWYEAFETREAAFRRERRIKEWRRDWKLRLIEALNPAWADLYERLEP
ncbi:MAG: GIY-YIG nuclease family protein [Caulobacteraceae bacterium]|nr:GIY-YIG nuclease family protein [Caulobacteraceae bacterium]